MLQQDCNFGAVQHLCRCLMVDLKTVHVYSKRVRCSPKQSLVDVADWLNAAHRVRL